MNLHKILNWRYATKKYINKKVEDDKLERIISAMNLSPSSYGIQPYRLIVIENENLRNKLKEYSFNPQIIEASHLIMFAALSSIKEHTVERYIKRIAEVRKTTDEDLEVFRNRFLNKLLEQSDEVNFNWAARQAYIALGTGLIAAAEEKVDATPIEGFDTQKFDELLGLKELGLKSVVIMALGYRDEENDGLFKMKKVRLPIDEFLISIN